MKAKKAAEEEEVAKKAKEGIKVTMEKPPKLEGEDYEEDEENEESEESKENQGKSRSHGNPHAWCI